MIRRREKQRRAASREKYKAALNKRKIPILTLDNKWHKLFKQTGGTARIASLTDKLNKLLARQGKLNTEMKNVKALKKKLMNNIVASMDDDAPLTEKRMEESGRLIEECNEKLGKFEDEYLGIPKEVDELNRELMLDTMELCYDMLHKNTVVIQENDAWIAATRAEMKKRLSQLQEAERVNRELYSYMHDIFGSDVIEIFDMQYNPGLKKQESGQEGESGELP